MRLAQAKTLKHPFDSMTSVKTDHADAAAWLARHGREALRIRLRRLGEIRQLADSEDMKRQRTEANLRASLTARKFGCKPHVPLMTKLQDVTSVEDKAVPELCLSGMPIVGPALTSPFVDPFDKPAELSLTDLLASATERREVMISEVKKAGSRASTAMNQAFWKKNKRR